YFLVLDALTDPPVNLRHQKPQLRRKRLAGDAFDQPFQGIRGVRLVHWWLSSCSHPLTLSFCIISASSASAFASYLHHMCIIPASSPRIGCIILASYSHHRHRNPMRCAHWGQFGPSFGSALACGEAFSSL